ncbi:MAG TPA: MATE family efflux transporter, partial [Propionibacteriaceae bacterium]|nr:MATE family efflux transporter [Propionibacteriaceae bacterium]
ARNLAGARLLTRTLTRWGLGFGVVVGAVLAGLAPFIAPLFTPDPAVQHAFVAGMWVLALAQPLCGYVFVLDGVLIGAGDARYLALAGCLTLVPYLPALVAVSMAGFGDGVGAIVPLWLAFGLVLMGARALTLGLRARTDGWMR